MIDALLTISLFGHAFLGIAAIVIFLILCFHSDIIEDGIWATFYLVVLGVLFYFGGKDSFMKFFSFLSWLNVSVYFGLGLIHAFVRVFFHGRKEMLRVKEETLSERSYVHSVDRDIKNHVFRWWFMWPISLINWMVRDMIKDIYKWCYDRLEKVFNFFLDLGVKSVPPIPKKPVPPIPEKPSKTKK